MPTQHVRYCTNCATVRYAPCGMGCCPVENLDWLPNPTHNGGSDGMDKANETV